jgi:hypothetical protein
MIMYQHLFGACIPVSRAESLMKRAPKFQIRSLTRLPVSATHSRVEVNITDDADVENADESVAFSVLISHKANPSRLDLQFAALQRAQDILASQRRPISRTRAKTIAPRIRFRSP